MKGVVLVNCVTKKATYKYYGCEGGTCFLLSPEESYESEIYLTIK